MVHFTGAWGGGASDATGRDRALAPGLMETSVDTIIQTLDFTREGC